MSTTPKTQVILAAAGEGKRLGAPVAKPFVKIHGQEILTYSLRIFEKCSLISSVIIVTHPDMLSDCQQIVARCQCHKVTQVVAGGATRRESVANGLNALDEDTEYVVIHDAARPFVTLDIIEQSLTLCLSEKAVIVGVPVKPTIKCVHLADLTVEETLPREKLWEAQTPQVFEKDLICQAHAASSTQAVTDDASLVEQMGQQVKMVQGEYRNFKITTREDLLLAEQLLLDRGQQ